MFDTTTLPQEVRRVLVAAQKLPLTAGEIFDRLPSRDALLVDCARRSDAADAHELATRLIRDVLLDRLGDEVRVEVVEDDIIAVDPSDVVLGAATPTVLLYRLDSAATA